MKNNFYINNLFSKNILLGAILFCFNFPVLFAQESTENDLNTTNEIYHSTVPAQGTINNSGNWLNNNSSNNSSGREQQTDNANFGIQDNSATDQTTDQTGADNSSRSRGGVRRLGRASTTLDDPGGPPGYNPDDVPFDSNLNLMFLVIGILFASWVVVRKVSISTVKN